MRLLCLCAAALLAAGCSGTATPPAETRPETKPSGRPAATPHADTPAETAAGAWGTVAGQVTWGGGAPPELPPLKVTADVPHCSSCGAIADETWVVNKDNKGVKNVFVWLIDASDPKSPKAPPIHPALKAIKEGEVVMDQPCCKFKPRVLALREGQVLVAKNSSPVNHNFNYQIDNKIIPAGGSMNVELPASDKVINVRCNIHTWMEGWIRVFDHPYFAVTKDDGTFEIKDAPAGTYNVVMWHEGGGWLTGGKKGKPVEIKAGGVTELRETARPAE
jgi:hypothetical protein